MLPPRLKRPKHRMGPLLRKVWPRHRRWVRSHRCCVPGCNAGDTDFAHLRSAENAGMSQKPHDAFGVSLCRVHHIEQHNMGIDAFCRKYGIDLWAMAAEFAERSPDGEMRLSI